MLKMCNKNLKVNLLILKKNQKLDYLQKNKKTIETKKKKKGKTLNK